jgi:hypothetical protein
MAAPQGALTNPAISNERKFDVATTVHSNLKLASIGLATFFVSFLAMVLTYKVATGADAVGW